MSFRHLFLTSLLSLVAAATASSQTITLRGELDEGRSTGCYYCPAVPWAIKFSETPVRSATVDLAPYARLQLELTGTWDTTTSPHGLAVSSVQVVGSTFNIQGNGRIGTDLRFDTSGLPGAFAATFLAGGNGFVPVLGSTALLLQPFSLLMIEVGPLDNQGNRRFNLPIPNDPGLAGVRLFGQALVVSPSAPAWSTNPRVVVLQS